MTKQEFEYFEIRIPCQSAEVDDIESFLFKSGACSVTFRDAQDVAILEPGPGKMPLWLELEITAMYSLKDHELQKVTKTIKQQYSDRKIIGKNLQNQIWERTWLEHFKPMKFGTNTWIIPSEFEPVDVNAKNIYLDPGLAFGTGTHATTALCLQWIDENDLTDNNIIDFGCGSGILAIAALKHGASRVYCTDIDPQAIESTLSNCKNNQVKDGIVVIDADKTSSINGLDVIMANILAAPLFELVSTFNTILKPGGRLIMSGILSEQTDEIIDKYSSMFYDFVVKIQDDWASVSAIKKH